MIVVMAGAPKGNRNAEKAPIWTAAIKRALSKRSGGSRTEAIDSLAEQLIDLCEAGNLPALQELGNRLEGKPGQAVDLGGYLDIGHRLIIKDD